MHALREGLSFCEVDEHAVFLDVRRDRYFALDAETSRRFAAWLAAHNQGARTAPPLAQEFLRRDILEQRVSGSPVMACRALSAARQIKLVGAGPRHTTVDTAWALASILYAHACLRLLPFRLVVGRSRRAADPSHALKRMQCVNLNAFEAAKQMFPTRIDCLPHSLALRSYLASKRIRANLVFGVRLAPFCAHCWLQIDNVVVGDELERVSAFTPILIVS